MQEFIFELKHYANWFWHALFPPKCIICKKEGRDLCVQHCKFEVAPKNAVDFQYLDKIFAATRYKQKTTEQVVEYFKFKGFKHLADIMAIEIDQSCPKGFMNNAVLVPVPLHWTRHFWRGFNQAQALTQSICKLNSGLKTSIQLKRVKRTKQQARLGKSDRLKNLKNAFVWKDKIIPKSVILIDDVVASGSTLEAAAQSLKAIGVEEVKAIVFARGG